MEAVRKFLLLVLSCLAFSGSLARADYRDTVSLLRIGMLNSHPAMSDPLRIKAIEQSYSRALSIPVEIIRFNNLAALIDANASARVEYAIHTAVSFAATQAVCGCVQALKRPIGADGSNGFRAALIMRGNSTANPPVVAFSSEASLSGWALPHAAMTAGSLERPQLVEAGSVAKAVELLAAGQVDGVFGWFPAGTDAVDVPLAKRLFGGAYEARLEQAGELKLSWLSEEIYNGPHAVHKSLPSDLVEKIDVFLSEMPEKAPGLLDIIEPFSSGGYQTARNEDYRNLAAVIENVSADGPAITSSTP